MPSELSQTFSNAFASLDAATLPARTKVFNAFGEAADLLTKGAASIRDDFLKSAYPEITAEQKNINRMLDDGYGEYYVEALTTYKKTGQAHPDDLKIFGRYGLVTDEVKA